MKVNSRIKKAGLITSYTVEQLEELDRCMYGYTDPDTGKHTIASVYFAKNYARIQHPTLGDIPFDLYDYQEEMLEMFQNNNKSICLSARQTGKCIQGNTTVVQVVPLDRSIINTIRKFVLRILDRGLYDKLYGKDITYSG